MTRQIHPLEHAERIRWMRSQRVPWKEIADTLGRSKNSLKVLACRGRQFGGVYADVPVVPAPNPLGMSNLAWRAALAIREAHPRQADRREIWDSMYDRQRPEGPRAEQSVYSAVHRARTTLKKAGVTIRNWSIHGWYMDAESAARFDELVACDRLTCDQVTEGTK